MESVWRLVKWNLSEDWLIWNLSEDWLIWNLSEDWLIWNLSEDGLYGIHGTASNLQNNKPPTYCPICCRRGRPIHWHCSCIENRFTKCIFVLPAHRKWQCTIIIAMYSRMDGFLTISSASDGHIKVIHDLIMSAWLLFASRGLCAPWSYRGVNDGCATWSYRYVSHGWWWWSL